MRAFYQSLLGGIAQAASATSELTTDTEGYPAETTFSCFVPDFAARSCVQVAALPAGGLVEIEVIANKAADEIASF